MYFHGRYKAYSEAVIGGRGADIDITKKGMFRALSEELMSLARVQFIITLVIFLICMIFLPQLGFGGMTMRIYPCLASGYFILFLMYAEIIFMYYFNDMKGCHIICCHTYKRFYYYHVKICCPENKIVYIKS